MESNNTNQSPQYLCSKLGKDTKVSYFKSVKHPKKDKDIYINEYLKIVSNPAREREAIKLQALPISDYKKAKLLMPCITGSCVMDANGRSLKNILFLNGLAVIDFDVLPEGYKEWREFKEDLKSDPYTCIVHFSLSGRGLCVYVKIPIENNFKEIYLSLSGHYLLQYGAKLDLLADETRLRFIAYDPQPFLNENSKIYTDTVKETPGLLPEPQTDNFPLLSDPAENFNNSSEAYEVIKELLLKLGYDCKRGKSPVYESFTRPGGTEGSIASFNNQDVNKWFVHSTSCEISQGEYNDYGMYKGLLKLSDFEAQKALAALGYGTFVETTPMKSNGKESYSLMLDYLKNEGIRLNQLTGVIEINGLTLTDYHLSKMLTELSLFSGKNQPKDILLNCTDVIANGKQFHPFLEFIKELEKVEPADFSQPDELDKFINCFTSETPKDLIRIYLVRWLLGLFDLHVHKRMTKNVLVVSGAQNSGKTSLAKNILPESLKQYGKVVEFNQNKLTDSKIALCSILVGCFDEFEDVLTKSKSLSDFKNLTSSYDVFERRPYRRNHEQMFRSSIILATTNEKNILNDSTGNTRFLTIDIQAFDLNKYFTIDLFKLWRIIYDLHLLGQTSVLNQTERALQAKENINFESEDYVAGLIENIFKYDADGFLNTTEILIELEKQTKQPLSLKRIGAALRKMGIERTAKKINRKVLRGYNLKFRYEN